jgi:hypothetical protein
MNTEKKIIDVSYIEMYPRALVLAASNGSILTNYICLDDAAGHIGITGSDEYSASVFRVKTSGGSSGCQMWTLVYQTERRYTYE